MKYTKNFKDIKRMKECFDCSRHVTNYGTCSGTVNGCRLVPRPPKAKHPEINLIIPDKVPTTDEEVEQLLR